MGLLCLKQDGHIVNIVDETAHLYSDDIAHIQQRYQTSLLLDESYHPTTAHGVKYGDPDVLYSCLVLAPGGASGVHSASSILHDSKCILAVSSYLVCLQLPDLNLLWHVQVDPASCFGVYHVSAHDSYITHGELEITRVSYNGEILWSSSGKDIFSNGFTLHDEVVKVIDFNGETYQIELLTGQSKILKS